MSAGRGGEAQASRCNAMRVARGGPCHIAGRSLQASCPSLTRWSLRFAILAALGLQRRLHDTGNPSRMPRSIRTFEVAL